MRIKQDRNGTYNYKAEEYIPSNTDLKEIYAYIPRLHFGSSTGLTRYGERFVDYLNSTYECSYIELTLDLFNFNKNNLYAFKLIEMMIEGKLGKGTFTAWNDTPELLLVFDLNYSNVDTLLRLSPGRLNFKISKYAPERFYKIDRVAKVLIDGRYISTQMIREESYDYRNR